MCLNARTLWNSCQTHEKRLGLWLLTSSRSSWLIATPIFPPDPTSRYFFPTFNALRVIPNKLLGVLSMAAVPVGLITVPFIESINKFQNPFRRPVATSVFLLGTFYAIWMGIGGAVQCS